MTVGDIWSRLGIERTNDELLIRRAYGRQLKSTNPEDDAEAFKALRAAYEEAMNLARQITAAEAKKGLSTQMAPAEAAKSVDATAVNAPSGATGQRQTSVRAEGVEKLQSDFSVLDAMVRAGALEDTRLRATFAQCLASPALADIQTQLSFEHAMARWLIVNRPATDCLFADAASRFDWERREGGVALSRDIALAIRQLRDLQYWDTVKVPGGPYARACDSLTVAPNRLRLLAQMAIFNLDRTSKVLLLEIFGQHGSLVRKLNPAALEWWKAYFSRPRLSMEWLRLLSPLVPAALLLGLFTGSLHHRTLLDGYVTLIASIGFIAVVLSYKLFAIDKPTHWYRRRYRSGSPVWLRVSWFPGGLLALCISALLPQTLWSTVAMSLIGAACIAWAAIVAPMPVTGQPLHRLIGQGVLMNLAVIACWILLSVGGIAGPGLAMWPMFVAVLIAERIGASALFGEYKFGLPKWARTLTLLMLALAAVAATWLSFSLPATVPWVGFNTAILLTVVLGARTPSNSMTDAQRKIRYFILYAPAFFEFEFVANLQGRSQLLHSTSATHLIQIIAAWLMAGVILALAMVAVNEWKSEG